MSPRLPASVFLGSDSSSSALRFRRLPRLRLVGGQRRSSPAGVSGSSVVFGVRPRAAGSSAGASAQLRLVRVRPLVAAGALSARRWFRGQAPRSGSSAGASPVTRPCSAICASWRPRPEIRLFMPAARPVSGLAASPTSWPRRTSTPGRRAIARNWSGVERLAVHDAALVDEDVVLLGEVRDRLGGDHRVALDEGQRGRALEQAVHALGADLLGGQLREAVLDDLEGGVGLAQLAAELSRLGNADAAVVDGEDGLGVAEPGGDLLDYCCLSSVPCSFRSRPISKPAHWRARERVLGHHLAGLTDYPASGLRQAKLLGRAMVANARLRLGRGYGGVGLCRRAGSRP